MIYLLPRDEFFEKNDVGKNIYVAIKEVALINYKVSSNLVYWPKVIFTRILAMALRWYIDFQCQ
jgi:hypothetical protein